MGVPDGFRFGVATAGFQIEGGYNGPGQPANNWGGWERAGRVEPSGKALGFWDGYEQQLDRAVAAGCDAFRLSVEWARVERAEGAVDDTALDRYAAILDACGERGLEPLVTLHHFTHPAWLGEEFWLSVDAPERFAAWVTLAAGRLADRCRQWVTLNEINVLALQSYLTGVFPPGRRGATGATVRALDHLLAAHVLAYGAVRARRPDAVVATNTFCLSVYELDRLLTDVLLARSKGVGRHDLGPWLEDRRAEHYAALGRPSALERALRRLGAASVPLDKALPRAVAAVYDSPHARTLDVLQLDWYDPVAANHFRLPGHRTAGGRTWLPARMLWDDPVDAAGMAAWCRLNARDGLPLWIVENGLCNRVVDGRAYPRADGWDRVRYLEAHLAVVADLLDAGVDIGGYYHWTLADNYEWGSYEPRFGLYGIDRAAAECWHDVDSMDGDAAGTYRRLITHMRES